MNPGAESVPAVDRAAVPAGRVSTHARPLVVVVGNPNVGKTTLFNRLTGQNARVGNYPGVTVERRVGALRTGAATSPIDVVDVPGAYSLSARSAEEQIALNGVLGFDDNPKPALAVVVVDAGQLIRNLYLVLQLVELRVPLVVAVNMIDEVAENPPNLQGISSLFGVPCVATNGRTGEGLDELSRRIRELVAEPRFGAVELEYPAALRSDVDRVADVLPASWKGSVERSRALALWALTSIDGQDELTHIDPALRERCQAVVADAKDRDIDHEIIATRYAFLDANAERLYGVVESQPRTRLLAERIDQILLHPVYGLAAFVVVMFVVFQALFSWSDPAIGLIETTFGWLAGGVHHVLPAGIVRDLLSEGVIGGVGNVVVFLPQILLLFLFIGILEDSGYMARVAYLMDRVMKALGLHGRAFVPMMSGFACAVPAILATRTMERQRDRLLTMLVVPLMTCSARLPVYTLIIGTLFPARAYGWLPVQGLLMIAMYVFATVTTLVCAAVLGRTAVKGRRIPLILELPPYRIPQPIGVLRMMADRAGSFLREAGTVILACTIVLWALLSFPRPHAATPSAQPTTTTTTAIAAAPATPKRDIAASYGGRLGHAIEPALKPLGFDWRIGVGLIGAFAAREVFVSTMGLVYGIGDDTGENAAPLRARMRAEKRADGSHVYTPLMGLSLLLFFALACQCMSTLAVVRRETKTWRWPAFMLAYMTGLAYVTSLVVYQGGKLLGF